MQTRALTTSSLCTGARMDSCRQCGTQTARCCKRCRRPCCSTICQRALACNQCTQRIGADVEPSAQTRYRALAIDFDDTMTMGDTKASEMLGIPENGQQPSAEQLAKAVQSLSDLSVLSKILRIMRPQFNGDAACVARLERLRARGVRLYVVSFGFSVIIEKILAKLGILRFFDDVLTPSKFLGPNSEYYFDNTTLMGNKNAMLERILAQTGAPREKIVLADDFRNNIEAAAGYFNANEIAAQPGRFSGLYIAQPRPPSAYPEATAAATAALERLLDAAGESVVAAAPSREAPALSPAQSTVWSRTTVDNILPANDASDDESDDDDDETAARIAEQRERFYRR